MGGLALLLRFLGPSEAAVEPITVCLAGQAVRRAGASLVCESGKLNKTPQTNPSWNTPKTHNNKTRNTTQGTLEQKAETIKYKRTNHKAKGG